MKIILRLQKRRSGSAVFIVMVVVACLTLIVATNATTLFLLKRELQRLDRTQQARYGQDLHH